MRPRTVVIIGVLAVLVALVLVVIRTLSRQDISADDFRDAVRNSGTVTLACQASAPSDLPLLISLRFPGSDPKGSLGFPDRTDIFTFASGQGHFDCHAYIRQHRVCLVLIDGGNSSKEFRAFLTAEFPGLSIQ